MKNRFRKYSTVSVWLLAVLCFLPASCIKEDNATDKATVTLTFTTRATTGGTSTLLENEQMKHLRIIMVNSATGRVLYNVIRAIDADATSHTMTFGDVEVDKDNGTNFDFYAVANEASLSLSDAAKAALESEQGTQPDMVDLQEAVLATGGFVNPPTVDSPLPQTAIETGFTVKAQASNSLTMPLTFVCAKVQVTFYNKIEEAVQTVTDIRIPDIKADLGYLFKIGDKTVVEDAGKSDLVFSDATLPARTEAQLPSVASMPAYIYPTSSTAPYTLNAWWGGRNQTLELQSEDATPITEVPRGKVLNIEITLLPGTEEFDYQVEVQAWGTAEMQVPPFE